MKTQSNAIQAGQLRQCGENALTTSLHFVERQRQVVGSASVELHRIIHPSLPAYWPDFGPDNERHPMVIVASEYRRQCYALAAKVEGAGDDFKQGTKLHAQYLELTHKVGKLFDERLYTCFIRQEVWPQMVAFTLAWMESPDYPPAPNDNEPA